MDLSSTDTFPQILISLAVVLSVFVVYIVVETLYRAYLSYGGARIPIYPFTGSAAKTLVFKQDPANPSNKTLPLSENQLSGIEFSYSTFLYISDDTVDSNPTTEGWKVIFYKGYENNPFPLCGPCVMVSSTTTPNPTPILRVVMNTYEKWFNAVDVKQIPFNKWFHLVIVLRNNTLEVYVNGNLANKKNFAGTLPYQNYQPLVLFPNVKTGTPSEWRSTATDIKKDIPVDENFILNGKFSGYISNLIYFSYALTYSEIQGMLTLGPSSSFDESAMDKPPYLIDSWWVQRKG